MLRNLWMTRSWSVPQASQSRTGEDGTKVAEERGAADIRPSGGGHQDGNREGRAVQNSAEFAGATRHVHAIMAAFGARLGAEESCFSLAASSLSGLTALQAAVAHDHHRIGRGLAACARAVLMEKLYLCPPKRRTGSEGLSRAQRSVRVELEAPWLLLRS